MSLQFNRYQHLVSQKSPKLQHHQCHLRRLAKRQVSLKNYSVSRCLCYLHFQRRACCRQTPISLCPCGSKLSSRQPQSRRRGKWPTKSTMICIWVTYLPPGAHFLRLKVFNKLVVVMMLFRQSTTSPIVTMVRRWSGIWICGVVADIAAGDQCMTLA